MKKKISLLAALLAVLPAAAGAAGDKPEAIRIGVAQVGTGGRPVSGWSFTSIVADNGSLEEEFKADGIPVKWTYFSGAGPAVNEALANGQLDFAFEGDLPSLVAKGGGLPTRLIVAVSRFDPVYLAVPADSTARSLEDLKGKRVAVFKGTNLQLAFANVLAARGLKESDFKLINMSTFDANAALLSKDIDAQVSGADLFPLVDRGVARIIHSTQGDPKAGRLTHFLVQEPFAKKYPQVVQRVVNRLVKDAAWFAVEANRARSYQIWTKSGLPLSAWKGDYDAFVSKERGSPLFDEFYRAHYKRLLKSGRDLKLIRKDFDIDAWIDPSYLEKAIKDLGLAGTWAPQPADFQPTLRKASVTSAASQR
ncbi:MAG TPA: ABC transporter substrate-binding protein [Anaeromyxobacteraceae bacterium]|nr:ABC transporter substrate-binding protein [Anaeromyxobacteraceae bacterium]